VKVLGNKGWGWDSSLVAGILYIAGLKDEDPENGEIYAPMVINLSLGAPYPLSIEKMAIDYAISKGIIVVAAAGNLGEAGMDWPGAYPEVISAGACGWTLEVIGDGEPPLPWWRDDVPEDLGTLDMWGNEFQAYITDFSGRELLGTGLYEQDLDVVAPGSWVIGPCMLNGIAHPRYTPPGKPREYYPVGGTSVSAPHISGIVALMLQVDLEQNGNQTLDAPQVETILENTALPIAAPSSALVYDPFIGTLQLISWDTDATGAGLVQADAAIDPSNW
jgi:subtilisin family serine protease